VRRTLFLIWKELLELRQDPKLLRMLLVAPILQLGILGYAATTDVRNVPIVVADADRTRASRDLIERFEASPYFSIAGLVTTVDEIDPYLERSRAWMALSIPAGYGQAVGSGAPATVQVVADGTDANSTTVALGYATNLVATYAQTLAATRPPVGQDSTPTGADAAPTPVGQGFSAAGANAAPTAVGQGFSAAGANAALTAVGQGFSPAKHVGTFDPQVRVWFNPQLESKDFMIPGVLALLLLVMTAVLGSMGIVREKELGTLEQLNVTPLGRWQLIVGKLLPYGLIGAIDVFLVVAIAVFWFQVPLRGSFLLLFVMSMVYLLSTLGLGLFVSTISNTQQQAMITAAFFVVMPMLYLSGFIFPIENMPAVIQPLTYLIPLRYYLVIVRGIFLKGVGLETFWREALELLVFGVAILSLAAARARKRAA
jgi:ABC-2 type transport system permease protein